MKVAFRTDASLQMDSGHVMRCLTLADALKAQGAQCYFISRAHPGHLLEAIHHRDYKVNSLVAPVQHAQAAIKKIAKEVPDPQQEPAHAFGVKDKSGALICPDAKTKKCRHRQHRLRFRHCERSAAIYAPRSISLNMYIKSASSPRTISASSYINNSNCQPTHALHLKPVSMPATVQEIVTAKADEIVAKWIDFFVLHKSISSERITRRLK